MMVSRWADGAIGGPPEALAAFLKAEQDKWGKVIRDLGIKLQQEAS